MKTYTPTDYALYLRKSRADLEAEAHGEGDTLHHERAVPLFAKGRDILLHVFS